MADEHHPPHEGVLSFGEPGEDIELYEGEALLGGDAVGRVRIWLPMTRGLQVKWRALDPPHGHLSLGRQTLTIEHPQLGTAELPADVNHSDGWGASPEANLGTADDLVRVVVHWLNLPIILPADVLANDAGAWAGRLEFDSCGWHFTMDSRPDHWEALQLANRSDEQYLMTHVGEMRRVDGSSFDTATAADALFGWQAALSFALGRWVAPAVPVGFDGHGRRIWEQWAPWRCDTVRGYESWWDTHTGDDLAEFVAAYLRAYLDGTQHDEVRMAAMHVITANHAGTTTEGKVMLAQAGLEYLAWVRLVLSGQMSRKEYREKDAAARLRLLLQEAQVDTTVPDALPGLRELACEHGFDGPSATAWVRNRLVHPKDAGEPYRIEGLVWQTAQLLLEYGELLVLHGLGYKGRYMHRYPPHRWAHSSEYVPWASQ
ncbi:MAG TPA: hypothetical protein VFW63_06335 [Acidimicrobiales bacterium]|nr:hypothetical protein [Acidimicrobiales bacterium]